MPCVLTLQIVSRVQQNGTFCKQMSSSQLHGACRLRRGCLVESPTFRLLQDMKLKQLICVFHGSQNLKIKQQIFADLEKACRRDAILSTNTSTINIELVGAKTQVCFAWPSLFFHLQSGTLLHMRLSHFCLGLQ